MKKNASLPFIISLILIAALYEAPINLLEMLTRRPFRGLETFTRIPPQAYVEAVVCVIAFVVCVRSFLQIVSAQAKSGNGNRAGAAKSAPVNTSAAAKAKPRTHVRQTPGVKLHQEEDEAIHCAHLTGKAKYLQQIDGYLKTGLIDRDEYRVLKERYQRLDIPDDYH